MIRYLYMEQNCSIYRIAKMAQWLQVSKSGYYAWHKRFKSLRGLENEVLLKEIIRLHEANGCLTPEEYYERHKVDLKAA